MNKDTINDISQIISAKMEAIYNTGVELANVRLLNHYRDNRQEWAKKQRGDLVTLRKDVNKLVKEQIKPLFYTIEFALLLAYKYSSQISQNSALTGAEVKDIKKEIKELKNTNFSKELKALQKTAVEQLNELPQMIVDMQKDNINEVYTKYSLSKETEIEDLYQDIIKQTERGIEKSPMKRYKNGREVPYAVYVDMKARTDMNRFVLRNQLEAGRNAGLVFYACNSFGDSAKDHVDKQGKMYIDKDWESVVTDEKEREKINAYIMAKGIEFKQDVEDGEPYLCTRPNCRHTFMPINTEEVLTHSTQEILQDHNLIRNGAYEEEKAKARDELRYQERHIRKEKLDKLRLEEQIAKSPKGEERDIAEKELVDTIARIKYYQKNAREIVKNNGFLDRNLERENPRIVDRDYGAKYY